MFKELAQDNLGDIIDQEDTVLVQFAAGWCGNCRIMKPKFKKLSRDHDEATFIVVDAEKFPGARQFAKVDNLPTFAAFKSGELVGQVQTNKYEVLKGLVDEVTSN